MVEKTIAQLDLQFDTNAIKLINEICKCNIIDGANISINEVENEDDMRNASKTMQISTGAAASIKYPSSQGFSQSAKPSSSMPAYFGNSVP